MRGHQVSIDSSGIKRVLATVLVALVLVSLVVSDAARASTAEDVPNRLSTDAVPDGAVEGLVSAYGLSEDIALDRLLTEPYVDRLNELTRSIDPEIFAGFWRDLPTGHAVVGLTDVTEGPGQLEAPSEITDHVPVRFVEMNHTLNDLEVVLVELVERRNAAESPSDWATHADLDLDVTANEVTVLLNERHRERVREVQDELDQRYGVGVVRVSYYEGPPTEPEVCTTRVNCDEAMRGGLRITNSSGGGGCTSGFVVIRNGFRGMLTAGHCGTNNWYRNSASNQIGLTQVRQVAGSADSQFVRFQTGVGSRGWVYRSHTQRAWPITARVTWGDAWVGMNTCQSGATTNNNDNMCGTVATKHYPPASVDNPNPRFMKAYYCSDSGDSGAGVVNANRAVGIHLGNAPSDAGGTPRSGCDVRPHRFAAFTSSSYMLLGATMVFE